MSFLAIPFFSENKVAGEILPPIPTSGLVLRLEGGSYPGSGTTWSDESGNSNNGTLTNSPSFTSSGDSSYFDFIPASSQYVDIANSASLNPTTGISIVTWFKIDTLIQNQNIVSKGYTSVALPFVQYSLKMNDTGSYDKLEFNLSLVGTLRQLASNTTISTGTWYLAVATYDKTSMKIYINNSLDPNTNAQTSNISTYTTALNIGRWPTLPGQYLDGKVNNVLIYNRALSVSEIDDIWIATKDRFGY